ncbi:amidohydrolase [Carboxydochorda subterranea]|uniref:Amidohydrolase n=1 Tax=Carboxydichorda subterranea TaxID=3109565 RepID=A0ABZ1C078_9FIRM|nr:amidohydrolase [Limnochorda sp. L945t]WRP17752.1 amidohydrolase [Limnochorda sp. L945t]
MGAWIETGDLLIEGVRIDPQLGGLEPGNAEAAGSRPSPVEDGAIWIAGGRIRAIGPRDAIASLAGRGAVRFDGQGALALPGLWDSHLHLGAWAMARSRVDLRGCRDLDEVASRLRARDATLAPGAWLVAVALERHRVDPGGAGLDGRLLDRLFPHRPVAVFTHDLHSVVVNRRAFELLAPGGPDAAWPQGAVVQKDPRTGEPTGVLQERAVGMVDSMIAPGLPELTQQIAQAQVELARLGITGVQTPDGPDEFAALSVLRQRGALRLRVRFLPPVSMLDTLKSARIRQGFGDEWLALGQVKAFADGSLGSLTAALFEPYAHSQWPSHRGQLLMDAGAVATLAAEAARAGFSLAIHAIGDRACRAVVDGLERARSEGAWLPTLAYRMEHVQLIRPEDMRRLAALGVVASMQPVHAPSDRPAVERHWVGRTSRAYAWRSLRRSGVVLAFGSDAPVETADPLDGLFAALTGQWRSDAPGSSGWHQDETLSLAEAVAAYTAGAAAAVGEQEVRGTLRPGMAGDVVLVSPDLREADPATPEGLQAWRRARVVATIVGGQVVYPPPA